MPRWLKAVWLIGAILFPSSAFAQTPIVLSSLQVQLWPEYDQPSMLVIYDFQISEGTQLPVNVSIQYPQEANLVAVAVQAADGSLLNADYLESSGEGGRKAVVVHVQSPTIYRIEYYEPLSRSGDTRQFAYDWPGEYAVQDFGVSIRMPADATAIAAEPAMESTQSAAGTTTLEKDFGSLAANGLFTLRLSYTRDSDTLTASQQDLQPSQPLDAGTPGRVMLSNYLPYILGTLGLVLIGGGMLYFWQSSRGGISREKRHPISRQKTAPRNGEVYCHQCGARAEAGDRFCRVCGTRLKLPE